MKAAKKSYGLRGSVLVIGIIIYLGALIYANNGFVGIGENRNQFVEVGKVRQILEDNSHIDISGHIRGNKRLELEILTGEYAGKVVDSTYFFTNITNVVIAEGDRLSIRIFVQENERITDNDVISEVQITNVDVENPERREILMTFMSVFLVILGIIGGKRGLMAIAGLGFTLVSIFFLLVPLMLKGYSVILSTLLILALVTVVSLILLGGWTPKIIASILGCFLGVATAASLAHFVGNLTFISGLNMEDIDLLFTTNPDFSPTQASGLFISGVLIASLGAVMDTAMSVSSAMEEIKLSNPRISPGRLFKAGMNVGRDTMGTMTNTLILAFAGSSLNMMLIIYSRGVMFNELINNDFIASELIRSLAGSLGIILTVPAVAFISAMIMGGEAARNQSV